MTVDGVIGAPGTNVPSRVVVGYTTETEHVILGTKTQYVEGNLLRHKSVIIRLVQVSILSR